MKVSIAFVLISFLFLTGCQKSSLYSALDEQQINEMIVILSNSNIAANKKANNDETWNLYVPQEKFSIAMDILSRHGLPKEQYANFGDVFKKKGMISSPTEERARLTFALSQDLSKTLSGIDGVISARVHIAMPEKDILAQEKSIPSASVLIRHKSEYEFESKVPSLKALVANSIEGLSYDNVSVALFPVQPLPPVQATSASGISFLSGSENMLIGTGIFILVGGILLLLISSRGAPKEYVRQSSSQGAQRDTRGRDTVSTYIDNA